MISEYSALAVVVCLIALSAISYYKKALDKKGVILANIFGIAAFLLGEGMGIGGLTAFGTIVALFFFGELATRFGKKHKERHPVRTIGNIVGNCGAALIFLVLGNPMAFFASISAALADTFSSEIGMTSKKKPIMITSLKPVQKGTDGAVSRRGTVASVFGAAIVAIIAYCILLDAKIALAVLACGILGSAIDSVLGALFERKRLLNNTLVNFFACLGAGIIAILLGKI